MGGVGGRGLILVIVWGYGVGVMGSLTGFMGMVVRFLVTLIPGVREGLVWV